MSTATYDAIIVGARAAGASTAMLLARRGYRVLLLERSRVGSNIPHGHMIHKDGPRRLHDWGLLDRIVEAGTPPVDSVSTYFGDFPLVARNVRVDGVAWGYGPRRQVLDQILAEAAVEAGAELREGFTVDDLTFEDGTVTGIRGHADGREITERATITIGADGRNSRVARAVDARVYDHAPTLLCYYFTYWSGVPHDGMEMYDAHGRAIFAHPTTDGLFATFVAWPVEQFHEIRSDVGRYFMEAVDAVPGLGERLRQGEQVERFYGTADLPTFRRKPYGPGWALVGDAGSHKDPYMALGISDALRDADLLASAIDDGLASRRPLDEALAEYERQRNALGQADYVADLEMARLQPPPPEMLGLRMALRDDPEETTRFWMARVGLIPPESFFNPEHLGRLMEKAGAATPSA